MRDGTYELARVDEVALLAEYGHAVCNAGLVILRAAGRVLVDPKGAVRDHSASNGAELVVEVRDLAPDL